MLSILLGKNSKGTCEKGINSNGLYSKWAAEAATHIGKFRRNLEKVRNNLKTRAACDGGVTRGHKTSKTA